MLYIGTVRIGTAETDIQCAHFPEELKVGDEFPQEIQGRFDFEFEMPDRTLIYRMRREGEIP
jgi:hypothetical protein